MVPRSNTYHDSGGQAVEMMPLNVIASDAENGLVEVAEPVCTIEESTILLARRLLYLSHLFAQFSEVAWQFCNALFLAAITDYQSLILVSTYGIATGAAVCIAGPVMGRFIDSENRLKIAQRLIWLENLAVVVATIFYFVLLSNKSESVDRDQLGTVESGQNWLLYRLQGVPLDFLSLILLIGIHILGAAADVLDKAFLVSIERDWVVVLSQAAADALSTEKADDSESTFSSWLSQTNIAMRQIDLGCKVAAPSIAGLVIPLFTGGQSNPTGVQLRWACLLVGTLNVTALVVEYICTRQVYDMIPSLALKHPPSDDRDHDDEDNPGPQLVKNNYTTNCGIFQLPHGLRIYMDQSVSFAGIALAMLYLNSLTLGNGIMTTYLLFKEMKVELIGISRGIASVIGLLGTVVYHLSAKRMSLEATGMWSIIYEFGCLALSFASLYVDSNALAIYMLIVGVCLSRIGLWVFDIAVTQLQQERIPADVRGVVGGVQQSLNAFFGLLCFSLGVVFPRTQDFHVFVFAAFGSVGVAVCFYAFGFYYPKRYA